MLTAFAHHCQHTWAFGCPPIRLLATAASSALGSTGSNDGSSSASSTETRPKIENWGITTGGHHTPSYKIQAACVLERLPILMPPPEPWELEHAAYMWKQEMARGELKSYPRPAKATGEEDRKADLGQELRQFTPGKRTTAADASGSTSTMKRCLEERLFMLVRRSTAGGQPGPWHFPMARIAERESISGAAKRALHDVIGRAHPVFFIGKAPMAHLIHHMTGKCTFFHLAQVVDDPWEVKLQASCGVDEHAWVTKSELPEFLKDARMNELVQRML
ncbi:MAG: hypothetical protein WDW38_008403 [Sanguina aurantia]